MRRLDRSLLSLPFVCVLSAVAMAAEPVGPLAQKGELVFSDDFSGSELGKAWKTGIPEFVVADGAMKGWQAREDHGSTTGAKLALPDGNAILELRFRLDGAKSINVNLDDKSYKGVHAGHISRVVIRPKQVVLYDDKDGVMRNDIYELRKSSDPAQKKQGDKMAEGRTLTVPVALEQGAWHRLGVEVVGDTLRVTIDDKEIGRLKSSGLTHPNKSDLRIGVWGKEASIDDLKIWSVAAAPVIKP
jgi:hypothetical protein